jgi:hypothetical protein
VSALTSNLQKGLPSHVRLRAVQCLGYNNSLQMCMNLLRVLLCLLKTDLPLHVTVTLVRRDN